jgi:hypothetical protein
MAHVIPTLRIATCPTYTAPVMRRKSDLPTHTRNPATDFGTILNNQSAPPAAAPAAAAPAVVAAAASTCGLAPTAQSLFGANPWSTSAGGTGFNGVSYSYNKYYFATPATAAKVAQMLGGKVVAMDAITPFGPFQQNQPNQMVQMPDGRLINAGLVAEFYDHGFTQPMVDKLIAAEVGG